MVPVEESRKNGGHPLVFAGLGVRPPDVLLGNLGSFCSLPLKHALPILTCAQCALSGAWCTGETKQLHFYLGLQNKWLLILQAQYISLPWPLEWPYGIHVWPSSWPWHSLPWLIGPSLNGQPWLSHWQQLFLPPSGAMMPQSLGGLMVFRGLRIFWQWTWN